MCICDVFRCGFKKKKNMWGKWLIFERTKQCRLYSSRAVALTRAATILAGRKRRQWRTEDAEGDGVQHTKRSRVTQYAESKDREHNDREWMGHGG